MSILFANELAQRVGVKRETINRHAREGNIPGVKSPLGWIFDEQELADALLSPSMGPQRGKEKEKLCTSTNAAKPGGLKPNHRTESAYEKVVKLGTANKRKSTQTSARRNSGDKSS